MSMQIRFEAWLLLLSLLVGCWLMLVYDLLRVLRLMIKHSSFVMGIEDFFYWIIPAKTPATAYILTPPSFSSYSSIKVAVPA